jgi:hypothetical protein
MKASAKSGSATGHHAVITKVGGRESEQDAAHSREWAEYLAAGVAQR